MAGWNGIFYNGVWSFGFDFLGQGAALPAGGIFDAVQGAPTTSTAFARIAGTNSRGIHFTDGTWATKTLGANLQTLIGGFAFQALSLPPGASIGIICTLYDTTANATQMSLGLNSSGQLQWYKAGNFGGSPLSSPVGSASPVNTILAGSFYFIEFSAKIDPTVGVVSAYVNGVHSTPVCTVTGNTRTTANSYINRFIIGATNYSGGSAYVDDLYLLDTTGASPLNAMLGQGYIKTDVPSGNSATGGLNQFTPTNPTNVNYTNVGNIPPNTAEYNADGTPGDRESYQFPALSSINRVLFLNHWSSMEIDAAGTRAVAQTFRSGGVDDLNPSPVTLSINYAFYNWPCTNDPNSGSTIASTAVSTVQAIELGIEITT